jgi:hypothetical protein
VPYPFQNNIAALDKDDQASGAGAVEPQCGWRAAGCPGDGRRVHTQQTTTTVPCASQASTQAGGLKHGVRAALTSTRPAPLPRSPASRGSWTRNWQTRRRATSPAPLTSGSCAAWARASRTSSCALTTSRRAGAGPARGGARLGLLLASIVAHAGSEPLAWVLQQLYLAATAAATARAACWFQHHDRENSLSAGPLPVHTRAPAAGVGHAHDADAVRVAGRARSDSRRAPCDRQRRARARGRRVGPQRSVSVPKARRHWRDVAQHRGAAAAGAAGGRGGQDRAGVGCGGAVLREGPRCVSASSKCNSTLALRWSSRGCGLLLFAALRQTAGAQHLLRPPLSTICPPALFPTRHPAVQHPRHRNRQGRQAGDAGYGRDAAIRPPAEHAATGRAADVAGQA